MILYITRHADALVVSNAQGIPLAHDPDPVAPAATEWVADRTATFWHHLAVGDEIVGAFSPTEWFPCAWYRAGRSRPDLLAAHPWPCGHREGAAPRPVGRGAQISGNGGGLW